MEPCKIRGTTQPSSHALGLEGKEISSPSGRGRKMSLTSPLIDPDFATIDSTEADDILETITVIRKPLSIRQALALLGLGVLIGYPSLVGTGHCAWAGPCPSPGLAMAGVFVGALSFISGLIAAVILAVKSVIR
jgi:hypothetical protein